MRHSIESSNPLSSVAVRVRRPRRVTWLRCLAAGVVWLASASASLAEPPSGSSQQVGSSQVAPARPPPRLHGDEPGDPGFRFRRLGTEEGLAQGSVYAILQDRRGFVWIGTQDGLHRYDGDRFVVLRPEPFEDDSLSHGLVHALAEDARGQLWVGTFRGADRLRPNAETFDRYLGGDDAQGGFGAGVTVEALVADDRGLLWAGTLGRGLVRFDVARDTMEIIDLGVADQAATDGGAGVDFQRIRALALDPTSDDRSDDGGGLWIGTDRGVVAHRSVDGTVTLLADLPGGAEAVPAGSVRDLQVDSQGRLWIATLAGLGLYDPATATGRIYRVGPEPGRLGHDAVAAVHEDRQGRLWVGTLGGGLCVLQPGLPEHPDAFRCFRHDPADPASLGHDHVRALAEDEGGLLWVGTALGGVTVVDTRPRMGVVHAGEAPGQLPAPAVRSFLEDRDGALWLGLDGGGVVRLDAGRFVRPEVADPAAAADLADERAWALHQDGRGRIWIGGHTGLWLYEPETGRLEHLHNRPGDPDSLGPGSVRWLLETEDGLWIALFGGGLDLLPRALLDQDLVFAGAPRPRFVHHRRGALGGDGDHSSIPSDLALVLFEDRAGQLWVGTAEGLARHTPMGRFYAYRHDESERTSLLGDIVRALHQDEEGNLWVGTDTGLNRLPAALVEGPPGAGANRFGFEHFTEADGLPNHTIYGILPDDEGHLWLSTNKGLARFDPTARTFTAFDLDDGVQDLEFNGGAQLRASDGRLYFGGVRGYNVFRPSLLTRNEHVPPVVITTMRRQRGAQSEEQAVWQTDTVELDHDDRIVSFHFAALDFSRPSQNRYAYRLQGLDGRWHPLGTDNDLTVTNLDHGEYVLQVRGSNDDGVWSDEPAQLRLRVHPAPWQTWWAYSLYTLGAGLVLGLLVTQTLRRRALQRTVHEVVRTSQRRLDLALRGSGDGLWDWDLETGEIFRSHVDHLLGAEMEEHPVDRPFADLELHPDDRERVERELEAHVRGDTERFEVEYRLLAADGWMWILDRGNVVERYPDGRPKRLAGTFKDMTDQKKIERDLRLWSAVFESVSEGVLIVDTWSRVQAVNPAFCRLTGWREDDLLGRRTRVLESSDQEPDFYRTIRRRLTEEGRWQGEVWQRRRNGLAFLAWVDINAVRDEAGDATHFVAVCTDITRRKQSEEELRRLANYDPLTGLPNRSQFQERMEQALADARRQGQRVAVVFGDLDRFKQINDTLGHAVGDLLLQEAARRLLASVRERDLVARLGGDEFTVLLTRLSGDQVVTGVAERILHSFDPPFVLEGHEVSISTSLGIALFPHDGDDTDTLLKHADTAMYEAKSAGRNRYRFWDRQMSRRAITRLELESRLRRALDRGELELYYQPQFDLRSGHMVAVEALVRWRRDGELLGPGEFLALAEETGQVVPLGNWVLSTALEQVADWSSRDDLPDLGDLRMAVNLSGPEVLHDGMVERVRQAMRDLGVEPSRLVFEVSEAVASRHAEGVREVLNLLHDLGVGLSVDDFGTGHGALGHLRRLPVAEIKIDRDFVAASDDRVGGPVVRAVVAMARNLDLRVVAEGVETEEQLAALRDDGCDLVQGYLLSRPVPAADIPALLAADAPWRAFVRS